jgi:putative hemolysin
VEEDRSTQLLSGETEVDGRLNLDDFAEETGIELPEGPYETVAGYVIATLGHLPEVGEECPAGEHLLTVVAVDGRRVSRVRVRAGPPPADPDPGPEVIPPVAG